MAMVVPRDVADPRGEVVMGFVDSAGLDDMYWVGPGGNTGIELGSHCSGVWEAGSYIALVGDDCRLVEVPTEEGSLLCRRSTAAALLVEDAHMPSRSGGWAEPGGDFRWVAGVSGRQAPGWCQRGRKVDTCGCRTVHLHVGSAAAPTPEVAAHECMGLSCFEAQETVPAGAGWGSRGDQRTDIDIREGEPVG